MARGLVSQEIVVQPGRTRLSLQLVADKADPAYVHDKYGKLRQAQLGYG